ncbi:MAG: response regulator transcription factor [Actinomycetia bacterium]|nr:response regulator transcription factor [Actinomycetes bacterium]MCP4960401.1 response regulator transcription factor [Actinomycetes bacterium]
MKALVIEDDHDIAEGVARLLRGDGYAVAHIDRGDDGLIEAQAGGYSVIILDVLLPGLNGFALCRALRAGGSTTPVVMLTAKDGPLDEADGLDEGADDYVRKPFHADVLLARVRAAARRGGDRTSSILEVGTLSLDESQHVCSRAGQAISLTPKEFSLLRFLMHRSPDVVTKTELLDEVFDPHMDASTNVVQVYCGYLRKKIDEPFGTETLRTVRGVGYQVIS